MNDKEIEMVPMKYDIGGMRAFSKAQVEECSSYKRPYRKNQLKEFEEIHPPKEEVKK